MLRFGSAWISRRHRPRGEESLGEWGSRVLGRGGVEWLVAPAAGIYAASPDALSAAAVLGGRRRRGTRISPRRGMQELVDRSRRHTERARRPFLVQRTGHRARSERANRDLHRGAGCRAPAPVARAAARGSARPDPHGVAGHRHRILPAVSRRSARVRRAVSAILERRSTWGAVQHRCLSRAQSSPVGNLDLPFDSLRSLRAGQPFDSLRSLRAGQRSVVGRGRCSPPARGRSRRPHRSRRTSGCRVHHTAAQRAATLRQPQY